MIYLPVGSSRRARTLSVWPFSFICFTPLLGSHTRTACIMCSHCKNNQNSHRAYLLVHEHETSQRETDILSRKMASCLQRHKSWYLLGDNLSKGLIAVSKLPNVAPRDLEAPRFQPDKPVLLLMGSCTQKAFTPQNLARQQALTTEPYAWCWQGEKLESLPLIDHPRPDNIKNWNTIS